MSTKKNLMSNTESLLKEISAKLDVIISNQKDIISSNQKSIAAIMEQSQPSIISIPHVTKIIMEDKK